MVLAVLLQNSNVFPAFSDRSTSGQPEARPPIDGKSFKKLEKLVKSIVFALLLQNSCVLPAFVDFYEI